MGTSGSLETGDSGRRPAAFQTLYASGHRIDLAATAFGPNLGVVQAYHTSVVVDEKEEYSFGGAGITRIVLTPGVEALPSHVPFKGKLELSYMGLTSVTGEQMYAALRPHFRQGTYDLLRKNCNSFSDCAIYCLLDARLESKYRGLEKIGHTADRNVGIVQALSDGHYAPNPQANGFDVDTVVREIDKDKLSAGRG